MKQMHYLAELALERSHEVGERGPAEGEHVDLHALQSRFNSISSARESDIDERTSRSSNHSLAQEQMIQMNRSDIGATMNATVHELCDLRVTSVRVYTHLQHL